MNAATFDLTAVEDRPTPPGSIARRDRLPRVRTTRALPQLHHYFERSADAKPLAPALVCGDQRLTYRDLDAIANRMSRRLVRLGIKPGDRVGLLHERAVNLYVGLLAILKAGATFVPLDPSFPADRVRFIAEDSGLAMILAHGATLAACSLASCRVLDLDAEAGAVADESPDRPAPSPGDESPCYIIYTSGTTGRPKGVAVSRASVGNFLESCLPIYGVRAGDRVYQGMTLAFDFSIEEVRTAFASGATLVAGPSDHRRLGSGLAEFLVNQGITVLACVPTLLATIDRDVPSLRVLLVGGEACPEDLVERWARPGRWMLNTYGPTEATVTATWSELTPGTPVTIGKPLPSYTVHILDDDRRPVFDGDSGEICIGGPGVAIGYVNRPELTREKFIPDPFSNSPGARLYRTGDLGRWTHHDEVEYLGRIDGQVKVRGYRIELGEIESVLREDHDVSSALVAPIGGDLAAYVTLNDPKTDLVALRARLHQGMRTRLPAYMVASHIEVLETLPMLPSGKADRSRLPAPESPRLIASAGPMAGPESAMEMRLVEAWSEVFGHAAISVDADFFLDLGGHSLFAASAVSRLRRHEDLRHLAIGDLYTHPTIRGLAGYIEFTSAREVTPKPVADRLIHSDARVMRCGAIQVAMIYAVLAILGAPLLLIARFGAASPAEMIAAAVAAYAIMATAGVLLPIAAKWLLIGRFRPGRYPLWGWYFCRWWLVRKLLAMSPMETLSGSPLMATYARMLGAKVGTDCHIGTAKLQVPDLITIEDGASLGYGVDLEPFLVEDGWLHLAPITIGAGAYVGTNSVVMLGGCVEPGALIAEQTLVARDQVIPSGESWAGSPSCRVEADEALAAMGDLPGCSSTACARRRGSVAGVLLLEMLPLIQALPGLAVLYLASGCQWACALSLTPIAGLLFVLTTCLAVALGKALAMPSGRVGVFPARSWFGLRKWMADKLMHASLASTNSLYATLYTAPWLRLLGARIGPRAEVSTVSNIDPNLLTIGRESFVADLAVLGAARYHRGYVSLGATEVGVRAFVGNAALVPGSSVVPDGGLIGVQSVPPPGPMEPGSCWLGSPAIFLPRRQESRAFDESVTFRPSRRLVACRLAVEALRVIGPATLMYAAIATGARAFLALSALPWPALIAILPLLYVASAMGVTGAVVALKWAVVGRYRPRVEPMWSSFVWRTELITALYENVAVPYVLRWLSGTPLMGLALRSFGATIGRRAYLETTFLTEFDLVRVGDDAMIGGVTSLQTHLFEDRVMKMSLVKIGAGCSIGPRSVILYDAEMAEGSRLDGLSLAMKGETLPSETRWRGIPARLVR